MTGPTPASPAPEGLDRLLALEDIKLLRAKYCRYIDSHQFPRLAEILTEDFVLDMSPTGKALGTQVPVMQGRDAILAMMGTVFAPLTKLLHIVSIPEIEFHDGKRASGIWRQETYIKENRPDLPGTGIAYCTVSDSYRREHDGWRIASVRVEIDVML